MSFANPGWPSSYPANLPAPPPMPVGYTYGQRAWQSGSWRFGANAGPASNPATWAAQYGSGQWPRKPPPNPGSSAYWATELKDNPLGLHNMHIKIKTPPPDKPAAPDTQNENDSSQRQPNQGRPGSTAHTRPQNTGAAADITQNLVWVPALADESVQLRGRGTALNRRPRSSSHPPAPTRARRSPPSYYRDQRHGARHDTAPSEPVTAPARRDVFPYDASGAPKEYLADFSRATRLIPKSRRSSDAGRDKDKGNPASSRVYERERMRFSYDSLAAQNQPQRRQSHDSYDVSPTRLVTASRPSTLPHSLSHDPNRVRSMTRPVVRSQTMPVDLREPRQLRSRDPSPEHHDAYTSRRELRPTFSPGIVVTPRHYTTPPRTPEDPDRGFRLGDRERDRDVDWDRDRDRDGPRDLQSRRTVDGYEYLAPSNGTISQLRHSASSLALTRHSSMPASVPASGTGPSHLSHIREEPDNLLSPLVVGADLQQEPQSIVHSQTRRARPLERSSTLPSDYESSNPSPQSINHSASSMRIHVTPTRTEHEYNARREESPPPSSYQPYPPLTPISPNTPMSSSRSQHAYRDDGTKPASYLQPPGFVQQRTSVSNPTTPSRPPYGQDEFQHSASLPRPSYMYRQEDTPTRAPPSSASYSSTPPHSITRSQDRRDDSTRSSSSPYATPPRQANYHYDSPYTHSSSSSPQKHISAAPSSYSQPSSLGRSAASQLQLQLPRNDSPSTYHTPSPSPLRPSASGSGHARGHSLSSSPSPRPELHNVRMGLWNRRGDHLTQDGFIVKCPAPRAFPKDLVDYPDLGFMDHRGRTLIEAPNHQTPEHPDSIAHDGRPPKRPYDTFVKFVLK